MAMEPCRECGKHVSTEAEACPNCGTPDPTGAQTAEKEAERKRAGIGCLIVTVLVVVGVAITGDGGGDAGLPEPDCLSVSPAVVEQMEAGLTVQGGGSLSRAMAVRSPDHRQLYYVAADLDGPGLEGPRDVGVWATNSLTSPGMIMAVGAVAIEFSDWGDGSTTDAATRSTDRAARDARRCLQ